MFDARITRSYTGEGDFHTYLIGGGRHRMFAMGNLGASDDFFLVGSEPEEETANYPLLTGNILESEGTPLFRLVRNVITINPGIAPRS